MTPDFKVKTLQIIPATGWYALVEDDRQRRSYHPVACWELVERTDDIAPDDPLYLVYGLGSEPQEAALEGFNREEMHFLAYVHESQLPPGPEGD